MFPGQGLGIFVSRDGLGEIRSIGDLAKLPDVPTVLARRFLPTAATAEDRLADASAGEAAVAGTYHSSRRAEWSWTRLYDLFSQHRVEVDRQGNVKLLFAVWPFAGGQTFARIGRNLYQGPARARFAFIDEGPASYIAEPAVRLQRVPGWLDVRWIAPMVAASVAIVVLTLLGWPMAAVWRRWRKRRWSQDRRDRRRHLAVRLVLLVDAIVVAATTVLVFAYATRLDDALEPLLLVLYGLAWLAVLGAILTLWAAAPFWRHGVGSRWSRVHHSLIAAGSTVLAWFFLTFHIAGTTLIY